MTFDVIIIGAGAAGLMAMEKLTAAGYTVQMLEAAPYAGGRISTVKQKGFEQAIELGAEFIHGNLPLTKKLLKQAGISYVPLTGKMVRLIKGAWQEGNPHESHWEQLLKKLRRQHTDTTIEGFLEEHFPGAAFKELREAAWHFAEGFDLADPATASILAVKDEWLHEEETQYRTVGGYGQLIDYLEKKCLEQGGKIQYNSVCTKIEHTNGQGFVYTGRKKIYTARKIIVTSSVAMLQAGSIQFEPELNIARLAIDQLGSGDVIKILLQFSKPFWKEKDPAIGFILSDELIPTWWTQLPQESHILTGWLGGPAATKRKEDGAEHLLHDSIRSLSSIFDMPFAAISELLTAHRVVQWSDMDFTGGGYSYRKLFSEKAIGLLNEPFSDTIYFAGEALHEGESKGTVEAALQSGATVARKIIRKLRGR